MKLNHPEIQNICVSFKPITQTIYDEWHTLDEYEDMFDDNIYLNCTGISAANQDQLEALHYLAKRCNWYEFMNIDSPGIFMRKEGRWIKT